MGATSIRGVIVKKLAAPAAIVLAGVLALGVAASSQLIPSNQAVPGGTSSSAGVPSALTGPTESTTPAPATPGGTAPSVAASEGGTTEPIVEPAPAPGTAEPEVTGPGTGPIAVDPTYETPPPVPNIGPSWGPDDPSAPTPGTSDPAVTEPAPAPKDTSAAVAPAPSSEATAKAADSKQEDPKAGATVPSPAETSASASAAPTPTASARPTATPTATTTPTPSAPFPGKTPQKTAPDNGSLALLPDSNAAAILTVFNAINSYRASLGLAPVKYHATVASLAQDWSNNIASREVIQHRPNFWTDPRALNPNNGAGEVIAVRWDRDAAQLVEWWKQSPGHDALLRDPRFNVMGIGITYTDGNWQTTPNRFTIWGVVNFFGYTTLPAGTTNSPGGGTVTPTPPTDPVAVCQPGDKHQPPTVNLGAASISSAADLVSVGPDGTVYSYPSLGNAKYGAAKKIGVGFTGLKELFVSDWDRDGVFDLIAQRTDGALLVYPGRVGGGFGSPGVLGQGWQSLNLAIGNWCANNRLPQIVAMDASGGLWLYRNAGLTFIRSQAAIGTGNRAVRLSMVDYNADGFQDLLTVEPNGYLRLYRGSGLGTPKQEARPVVGAAWTDYSGLRSLQGVNGAGTSGVAGLGTNGVLEYWDLTSGRLTTPVAVGGGWGGFRLAQ